MSLQPANVFALHAERTVYNIYMLTNIGLQAWLLSDHTQDKIKCQAFHLIIKMHLKWDDADVVVSTSFCMCLNQEQGHVISV